MVQKFAFFVCCLAVCLPIQAGGLVDVLAGQLGITDTQAAGGAGALLGLAQAQLGDSEFSVLSAAVPETNDLLAAAPKITAEDVDEGSTSLLENPAMLKGALGLARSFDSLDLDASTVQAFAPIVVDYFRDKGGDSAGDLLGGALMGGDSSDGGLSGLASAAPLLGLLSGELNVDSEQAAGGAAALLRGAQSQLGDSDFSKITDAVPGIQALLAMKPRKEESSSSDLLGAATSLFGGDQGIGGQVVGALGLADSFDKLGLDASMLDRFIPIIIDYVKDKGGEMVSNMMSKGLSDDSDGEEAEGGE